MVRRSVCLAESQSRELERRATEQGVSFSEMVRRSVDLFLTNSPVIDDIHQRAMEAVGYADSSNDDVSARHDDYLAEAYREIVLP
jgi:hypothetical protein